MLYVQRQRENWTNVKKRKKMHENKQIIFVAEKRRTISGNKNQSRGKHMTWMPNPLRATGKAVIIIFPPPAPVQYSSPLRQISIVIVPAWSN